MPPVELLILFICGNDVLKETPSADLATHVATLVELAKQKAAKVCAFMGGSCVMGDAPEGFDVAMEQIRAPLVEAGVYVNDMSAFADVQREDRLHFAESETRRVVELAVAAVGHAPLLPAPAQRKDPRVIVIYRERVWKQSRVVLVQTEGQFYPMCPWCDKRATAKHLLSQKCHGPEVGDANGFDKYWGAQAWPGAPACLSVEDYEAARAAQSPRRPRPRGSVAAVLPAEQASQQWKRCLSASGAVWRHADEWFYEDTGSQCLGARGPWSSYTSACKQLVWLNQETNEWFLSNSKGDKRRRVFAPGDT